MEDWLETLRSRYRINADAEFGIGRGWRGIVERFYASAKAILVDPGRMRTRQIKEKLGRLDIHVDVDETHRPLINWHIRWAEDEASFTCEHCGSPYASLTPARHIVECDDCRYLGLALDQRTRRASEIASAARRYVRDCARAGKVLDIEAWAERRWRRNSDLKRKAMLDAEQAAAVPAVTRAWVQFALSSAGLEQRWIDPVVAAVDQFADGLADALEDESAWGPSKQVLTDLVERGVDISDMAELEAGIAAYNDEIDRRMRDG